MSRFGDFAAVWFGTLVVLNFAVFRVFGAPLGITTESLLSIALGLVFAATLVYGMDLSLPDVRRTD